MAKEREIKRCELAPRAHKQLGRLPRQRHARLAFEAEIDEPLALPIEQPLAHAAPLCTRPAALRSAPPGPHRRRADQAA